MRYKQRVTPSLFGNEVEPEPKKSKEALEVDDLTKRLQGLFMSDSSLKSLVLIGELRESKLHTSGHFYFSLLGKDSRISCALFKQHSRGMSWVRDGDKVIAEGSVDIYPARGTYQFYARKLVPIGEGAIERARQETQMMLEAEGIFAPETKRALPQFPERITLVTSQTGAAVQDVLKVASTRWNLCEIVVVPTLVQGIDAPAEIVKAIKRAAFVQGAECVMLVRGGGGREDLIPFDDASVVRAVKNCPLPVITGLGHQQDTTLSDRAADFSAPTPSAAAERLFPDAKAIDNWLRSSKIRLGNAASNKLEQGVNAVSDLKQTLFSALSSNLQEIKASLSRTTLMLSGNADKIISKNNAETAHRAAALNALSPLSVLGRGFITCESEGKTVSSVSLISKSDEVSLHFIDGSAQAKIVGKQYTPKNK